MIQTSKTIKKVPFPLIGKKFIGKKIIHFLRGEWRGKVEANMFFFVIERNSLG